MGGKRGVCLGVGGTYRFRPHWGPLLPSVCTSPSLAAPLDRQSGEGDLISPEGKPGRKEAEVDSTQAGGCPFPFLDLSFHTYKIGTLF